MQLNSAALTLGFARRATPYKRAHLLLTDLARLKRLGAASGGLQLIYAGKAHPADEEGKGIIAHIVQQGDALRPNVTLTYLEEYDLDLAKLLVAGVDVWLNTPQPPLEASGTSGMKAALNGVPSLSVLDGWWIEGHIEGVTGWAVGKPWEPSATDSDDRAGDAAALEEKVVPLYRRNHGAFGDLMRSCIAFNGSFFNTHRMLNQYAQKAYLD